MQEISGKLVRLGSGTVAMNQAGKSFVRFDTIEIGDRILQKVRTARSLSDYISDALGQEVTLYVAGSFLIGVKLPSGKTYYWKKSLVGPVLLVLPCLMFAAVVAGATQSGLLAALAFPLFYAVVGGRDLMRVVADQPRLAAQGGIPLKS